MRVVRFLFAFWLLLADMMLVIDVMSYYNVMYFIGAINEKVDWFQLLNRDMNIVFSHVFIVLPFTFLTFYSFNRINKLNDDK
jgi:hypothetical protein